MRRDEIDQSDACFKYMTDTTIATDTVTYKNTIYRKGNDRYPGIYILHLLEM